MARIGALTTLVLFLLAGMALASETAYEKKMAHGVEALETGAYDEAITYFEEALSERPGDHTAALYRAITLSRGKRAGAGEALRTAVEAVPDDPRANLEMGIYDYGNGRMQEAAAYFEKAVALAPGSDIAALGKEYLDAARSGETGKPWRLNLWGGVQYDSNVVLNPSGGPLPQGISKKSDWKAVFSFDGSYKFLRASGLECAAGYGFYQSLHSSLSDFNVTENMATLDASYRASPVVKLGVTYLLDYAMVGGNGYYGSHGITPSVSITEGRDFETLVEYRYRRSHFIDSDLFRDNADRSGSNNAVGIMQKARISTAAAARIGYAHDDDSTRKDFWDYRGDRWFAGLTFIPLKETTVDLSGEYYRKKFEGPSPYSEAGEARKDDIYTADLSLGRKLSERLFAVLGYRYTKNGSNVAAFDFSRSVLSVMLNARF